MEQIDSVKIQRRFQQGVRSNNILDTIRSASDRYLKIRSDIELLDGEHFAIMRHIRSYPDYEYFLDFVFKRHTSKSDTQRTAIMPYYKFNAVRVIGDAIELRYEPLHYRFDNNNFIYGVCSVEDILNIEDIIKVQKSKYNTQK